jgi:hypothetical protein
MKVNSLSCHANFEVTLIFFLTVPEIDPATVEIREIRNTVEESDNILISWQKPANGQCLQGFSVKQNGFEEKYLEKDGKYQTEFESESCTTYSISITSIGGNGHHSYSRDFTTKSVGNIPSICSPMPDSFVLISFYLKGLPEIEIVSSIEEESCWKLEWKFKFGDFKDWQCIKPLELFIKLSTVSQKADSRDEQTNKFVFLRTTIGR